jgi:hypothetical protein
MNQCEGDVHCPRATFHVQRSDVPLMLKGDTHKSKVNNEQSMELDPSHCGIMMQHATEIGNVRMVIGLVVSCTKALQGSIKNHIHRKFLIRTHFHMGHMNARFGYVCGRSSNVGVSFSSLFSSKRFCGITRWHKRDLKKKEKTKRKCNAQPKTDVSRQEKRKRKSVMSQWEDIRRRQSTRQSKHRKHGLLGFPTDKTRLPWCLEYP